MAERPEDIGLDSKNRAERDRIDLNHEMASADIPDFGSAPEPAPGQHLTRAPC
ncbi:MAG: hypothetical protein AB2806_00920 [Candidatus Thiodiazotropha sp.]